MPRRRTSQYLLKAIARKIQEGAWSPGRPVPSLRSLALLFGVARATVDAAVREAVAEGLLRTQARRGTRVAEGALGRARQLLEAQRKQQGSEKIAILLPDVRGNCMPIYYRNVVCHVQRQAEKMGWRAEPVFWPLGRREQFPRLVADQGFDGALCIVDRSELFAPLYLLRQYRFPLVLYNRRFLDLPLPAVMFDEYRAVQRLGELLMTMGHRRMTLLLVQNTSADGFSRQQLAGWLDLCRRHELLEHWDEPVYFLSHPDLERGMRGYFRRRPLPSAIVLGGGWLAQTFLRLDDLGLRIPQDLSVTACYGHPGSYRGCENGALTAMRPDLERMAECSLEMLARMIRGEPYPPPVRLPCHLVRGDSIRPPEGEPNAAAYH